MRLPQRLPAAGSRVFYGWYVIARAAILRSISGGLHIYGFSIFFLPITRDLGLSRTATSLIFSLSKVEGAFEGPVAGHLIDRLGPRAVVLAGCAMTGMGYLVLSRAWNFPSVLLVYILLVSVGVSAGFQHGLMALANNWFIRRRAVAMAVISSFVSVGGMLITPLLSLAVFNLGWRNAAALAGVVFLAVGLPIAWGVRNKPENLGLVPLGYGEAGTGAGPREPAVGDDASVKDALRSVAFWVLIGASVLRLFGFNGVAIHFVPILVWKGIPETTAASLYLAALALVGIGVHLTMGWLADRFPKQKVLALGMVSGVVAILVLLYAGPGMIWLFLPFFAPVEALFPVTWATVGEFFGRHRFATIRGLITMFWSIGPVLGPVFFGKVFDSTQSYTLALQVSLVGFALSAVTFWTLRRPGPMVGQQ
ncbi:MAG: MFS transporter [Chloroflexi bacterium]|nr:MFS transporter [Chloroflexota bacterium]